MSSITGFVKSSSNTRSIIAELLWVREIVTQIASKYYKYGGVNAVTEVAVSKLLASVNETHRTHSETEHFHAPVLGQYNRSMSTLLLRSLTELLSVVRMGLRNDSNMLSSIML